MNSIRNLLPIGSVVLLEEATKRMMIYGIRQTDEETGTEYDYLGVVYPEGNLGDGSSFFFNHENIARVFFKGYEDEERDGFIDRLEQFYRSQEQ